MLVQVAGMRRFQNGATRSEQPFLIVTASAAKQAGMAGGKDLDLLRRKSSLQ
jgi:hypothetical protein